MGKGDKKTRKGKLFNMVHMERKDQERKNHIGLKTNRMIPK